MNATVLGSPGRARWAVLLGGAFLVGVAEVLGVFALYLFGSSLTTGVEGLSGASADVANAVTRAGARLDLGPVPAFALLVLGATVARGVVRVAYEAAIIRENLHVQRRLARLLMERAFTTPYERFIEQNSAHRLQTLTYEVERAGLAVGSRVRLAGAVLVLGLLVVLLVGVDWKSGLLGAAAGLLLVALLRPLMNYAHRLGGEKGTVQRQYWEGVAEPLRAYRVVTTFGAMAPLVEAAHARFEHAARITRKAWFSQSLIFPLLEIGVAFFLFAASWALAAGVGGADAGASALVLLFASAYRILPCISEISMAFHAYQSNLPGLRRIQDELAAPEGAPPVQPGTRPLADGPDIALVFEDVGFAYRNGLQVLQHVALKVRRGERVGIVGPSASGKSTLVDVTLGLLPPTSGAVKVGAGADGKALRIGYLPQSSILLDGTPLDNILVGRRPSPEDREKAARLLARVGLGPDSPGGMDLDRPLAEGGARLSGGQRQKLGLARALFLEPDILVLDEPTSSLDADSERQMVDLLASLEGMTLLVITHRSAPLRICSSAWQLRDGTLWPADALAEGAR